MQIRPARLEDYEAFARLFAELGVDDPTPEHDRFERDLMPRMIVATDGTVVLGYALHELLEGVGYIRNLVTAPAARRRGVGRALMQALREIFEADGASSWCLNVMPSNAPAVALYRSCGLEIVYTSRAMRIDMGTTLPPSDESADFAVGLIEPADDAELEEQFGLIGGQLASAREKKAGGRELDLLVFTAAGRSIGLAVFDPRFPGAFPFRLERPDLLPRILAYVRRRAPPRAHWIQLVVEDDDVLYQRLLELGANTALEFVHMRGMLGG
jgi:ribosomal protein S18 acetylase RimI-like enzyme